MPKPISAMPVTDSLRWRPGDQLDALPASQTMRSWMTTSGSLTRRIRRSCPNMQVKVLSERWQIPLPCESRALQMPPRQPAWIRCVLLQCGHSSLIYARTVIPDLQPDNPWHAIQKLGNQPLGEILFEREAIHRSPFEFAYAPYPSWPDLAGAETQNALNENGFARRSLFLEHQAPLLLTEVFLPAILELETQGR